MKASLIVIPALILSLAGCAELAANRRDYLEPTGGQTTKVRFNVNTNGRIVLIPDSSCVDYSKPASGLVAADSVVGGSKHKGQRLGIKGTPPAHFSTSEAIVTANRPITQAYKGDMRHGLTHYYCEFAFTWIPRAGSEYEVTVDHAYHNGHQCDLKITNLDKPDERVSVYQARAC